MYRFQIFKNLLLLSVLLNFSLAQLPFDILSSYQIGQTYEFPFNSTEGDPLPRFTLMVKQPSSEMTFVSDLGTARNGVFSWTVSQNLVVGPEYALRIQRLNTTNYSPVFRLVRASQSSTLSRQTSTTPPTSSSSTASPNSNSAGSGRDNGLTTVAKAGIGVGASVAGLMLILLSFFLGQRIHKKPLQTAEKDQSDSEWSKSELEWEPAFMAELDARETALSEMRTDADAKEMASPLTHGRTELDGKPRILEMDARRDD